MDVNYTRTQSPPWKGLYSNLGITEERHPHPPTPPPHNIHRIGIRDSFYTALGRGSNLAPNPCWSLFYDCSVQYYRHYLHMTIEQQKSVLEREATV